MRGVARSKTGRFPPSSPKEISIEAASGLLNQVIRGPKFEFFNNIDV